MKRLTIFYLLISIFSCQEQANKSASLNTKSDVVEHNVKNKVVDNEQNDKILDSIRRLPEVVARESYLDSLTNHNGSIALLIVSRPTKSQPYYWIKVGYDNEIRFETYYNFYVYITGTEKFEIKYYDVIRGKAITLKEWRMRKK